MMTEATNFGGSNVAVDAASPAHVQPLLDALKRDPGAASSEGGILDSPRRWVDLRQQESEGGRQAADAVTVMVEEGSYFYPLMSSSAGWGSVIDKIGTARLLLVLNRGLGDPPELLAEAQIRTDPSMPEENALQLGKAAAALIRQGALRRPPRAVATWPPLHVPKPSSWTKCLRIGRRFRRSLLSLLRPELAQWSIGIMPAEVVDVAAAFRWDSVRWLKPPEDGFIADPFLVKESGRHWLFYERLLFSEGKGTLWVAQLDIGSGEMSNAAEVLRTEFHLSFPNVFKADGEWYMLPEQARSGSTTLYRAVDFPYRWEKFRALLPDFPGIDPIIYFDQSRWWLFVTHGDHPCNENNLHLFSSESIFGEFVSHPKNPIHLGLHGSRMAGPILKRDGKVFRIGQDGRAGYGKGLVIKEIHLLSAENYSESHTNTWTSRPEEPFGHAIHSFMQCDNVFVTDGQMVKMLGRPSLFGIFKRIINKLIK